MSKTAKLDGGTACGLLLGIVIASVGLWFLSAWVIMLVLGGLHAQVATGIPAVSYWGAVLITLALVIVGSFFKGSKA